MIMAHASRDRLVAENIDIGGPTMVRAAAKNHARVSVVVNASDYELVMRTLPYGPDEDERKCAPRFEPRGWHRLRFARRAADIGCVPRGRWLPAARTVAACCADGGCVPRGGHRPVITAAVDGCV